MTFLVALAVALAATPGVVWASHRWQLVDLPNHRSLHAVPIPRGAGIAVALGTVLGVVAGGDWSDGVVALVVGSAALGAVGLADDRWGLPPLPRLAVQVLTPALSVLALGVVDGGIELLVVVVGVALVVAGYVNAFNFMDGINGISGMQAVVAGLFLAVVAHGEDETALTVAGVVVAGAALGFLPYNVPRAVIFLGDVGSYFLGAWLAGLALLVVDAGASALVVVAPFLLYLLDTSVVLVKRARRGEPLLEAHREHVYQRLVRLGASHSSVAGLCALVAGSCGVLALSARDHGTAAQLGALAACVLIVVGYLSLPAALEMRRGARVS